MCTGLRWGDEHDSGAGGRRRGVKRGLLVMAMMRARHGDGCKDELTPAFGHDASKTRSGILGAKIERAQISIEFFPCVCDDPVASVSFVTGELCTFCA